MIKTYAFFLIPINRSEAGINYTINGLVCSGKRDSNARPFPWQGDALPLSYTRKFFHIIKGCKMGG